MKAKEIIEATMPLTLRPKAEDRAKVIAAALRFVVQEFAFTHIHDDMDGIGDKLWCVVDVEDINKLIEELENIDPTSTNG